VPERPEVLAISNLQSSHPTRHEQGLAGIVNPGLIVLPPNCWLFLTPRRSANTGLGWTAIHTGAAEPAVRLGLPLDGYVYLWSGNATATTPVAKWSDLFQVLDCHPVEVSRADECCQFLDPHTLQLPL